jgi:hypothetical protein
MMTLIVIIKVITLVQEYAERKRGRELFFRKVPGQYLG